MTASQTLRRPDTLNPYRNSFNAIRLLAAIQVVYMHSVAHLQLTPNLIFQIVAQFPGVPIFFATSGFLVLDSFIRRPEIGSFCKARALRIYPALVVNILILEMVFAWAGGYDPMKLGLVSDATFGIVFLTTASQYIASLVAGGYPYSDFGFFKTYPSGVLWTLAVELSFYVSIPIFGQIARRKGLATVSYAILAMLSIGLLISISGLVSTPVNVTLLTFLPYFWMFAAGMIFRLWVLDIPTAVRNCVIVVAGLALAVLTIVYDASWLDWKFEPAYDDIIRTALVCILTVFVGASPLLRSALLVKYDVSYGVYLWHMLRRQHIRWARLDGHIFDVPARSSARHRGGVGVMDMDRAAGNAS